MVAVAPLLLLLNFSAESYKGCLIALGIFGGLLIAYTVVAILLIKLRQRKLWNKGLLDKQKRLRF